jgi:hypothetical protein
VTLLLVCRKTLHDDDDDDVESDDDDDDDTHERYNDSHHMSITIINIFTHPPPISATFIIMHQVHGDGVNSVAPNVPPRVGGGAAAAVLPRRAGMMVF